MRPLVAALGVVAFLLASSCSGDSAAGPTATVPQSVATTTTLPDPYAVPDVIDAAYINRVLAALDHIYGDAMRVLVRDKAVTPEFERLMRSIYTEDQVGLTLELAQHQLDKGLRTVSSAPGDPLTTVQRVVRTKDTCLLAAVKRDLAPISRAGAVPLPVPQEYVGLQRVPFRNLTSWAMAYQGFRSDGSEPPVC